MSIVTRTGDKGTTALMYGRRVMKCHPRVEACGAVDELNSTLGLARATAENDLIRDRLLSIQKELVVVMGELAVAGEDLERYARDGYSLVTPDMTFRLEKQIYDIEAGTVAFKGWATPGATPTPPPWTWHVRSAGARNGGPARCNRTGSSATSKSWFI